MLTNPCACKGSLSYVHEACLIQWLLAKNIRKCELCHRDFDIQEHYGSIWEILRNSLGYLFTNYKRLFKFAIYSVYMYLFFKRFVYVMRYFKDLVAACLGAYVKILKGIVKFVFMAPYDSAKEAAELNRASHSILTQLASLLTRRSKKERQPRMRQLLLSLLGQVFKVLSFLYNTFILVQLSCIGYAETFRIKKALTHVIN